MIEHCGYEFVKSVAVLGLALLFLLNGFSLSAVPPLKDIITEESLLRGCCILSIIYFVIFTIMGIINDHHHTFLIITFVLFFISTITSCAFLSQANEYKAISWIIPAYISGLIVSCKLLHTSYFLVNKTVINDLDLNDNETYFLFNSLIMEIILSLFYSLTPYVSYYNQDNVNHDKIFTVWAVEFFDIISHLIVALSYAQHSNDEWDRILTAYFFIYALNVIVFAVPIPFVPLFKGFAVYHMLLSDIITDIPMFAITIHSKSFVGNAYIAFDLIVKVVVMARGVIWIPIENGFCKCSCLKNDVVPTVVNDQYDAL